MKRSLSLALSTLLITLSLGPTAPAALAQAAVTARTAPVAPIVPTVALPRLAPGLTMSPALVLQAVPTITAASALSAAPVAHAAPATPFARTMAALAVPALETKDMSAGQSSAAAGKDFAARIGQDSSIELLVSAPDDSSHQLTQTVYPVALTRPGTSLKEIELSLHSQLTSFGLSKKMLTSYDATAVGAVSQINTVVLRASADKANAFTWALRALGYQVQEGRKFEVPKPQQAEPMSRTVGLKEMAAVIGADKLQAELTKVLGEPTAPGQKSSLISKLGRLVKRALGLAVENPVLPWAVLDSWVSVQHPFLKGHFIKSVTNDDDGESHGTHTSGTVVGMDRWNYAGRNYNIFPNGSATEGDILFKLNMAQEDGALATTNSWGDGSGNPEGAIEKLFVKTALSGMHHSVSAGNSGSRANTIGGPAIAVANVPLTLFGKVIGTVKRIKAIAASDADKRTASFSSRGPGSPTTAGHQDQYKDYPVKPDEAGVGVNLVAPIPRGATVPELGGPGGSMSGTSMSNPGVFGGFLLLTRAILVLLKNDLPAGTSTEQTQIALDLARYAMTQTAEKVAPVNEVGDGFINVWSAFQFAAKTLKSSLPSYRSDAEAISFKVQRPGLSISIEHGPYMGSHMNGVELQDFSLRYEPSHFRPGSLISRTLGREPLTYSKDDVRFISQSLLLGRDGVQFEVYLKSPIGSANREENGPLLLVSRDTGEVRLYPAGYDAGNWGIKSVLSGLWTEIQQLGRGLTGIWKAS